MEFHLEDRFVVTGAEDFSEKYVNSFGLQIKVLRVAEHAIVVVIHLMVDFQILYQ